MISLRTLICRFRRHRWTERGMLGLAFVVTLGMRGLLRLVSFARLVRLTGSVPDRSWNVDEQTIKHVVWAVRTVSYHLFPEEPCLPQAFAVRFLLGRLGVSTDLRIGVLKEGEELQAHAWVERGDEVLIGGADAPVKYHPLEKKVP